MARIKDSEAEIVLGNLQRRIQHCIYCRAKKIYPKGRPVLPQSARKVRRISRGAFPCPPAPPQPYQVGWEGMAQGVCWDRPLPEWQGHIMVSAPEGWTDEQVKEKINEHVMRKALLGYFLVKRWGKAWGLDVD
jgi:hypothetical protein